MVGVDVRRNFFEFSLSRIAKTALVKSFYEKYEASFNPLAPKDAYVRPWLFPKDAHMRHLAYVA